MGFYNELKKYIDKYYPGKILDASVQKYFKVQKKFGYYPLRRELTRADWVTHFFLSPIDKGDYVEGSLAFIPVISDKVYTVIIDIDRQAQKEEAIKKLLPVLQARGIAYVYENGGDNMDRCKIWIYCDGVELPLIKKFIPQIFDEAGLNLRDKNRNDYFDEVNPVNKSRNLVRHWLGAHLSRKGKQYSIEIDGIEIEDPLIALQKVNAMAPLTTEKINSQLKAEAEPPKPVAKRLPGKKSEKFHFRPKNLKLPKMEIEIPALLKPVYSNCQAAHSILEDIVFHRLIDLKGEQPHYGGFFTHRMAAFNDVRLSFKSKNKVTQGQKFFDYLRTTKRCRSDKDHNWDSEMDKIRENPDKFFPSCKAWEDKFDRCDGCEFKGKILSPKQFIYGNPLRRTMIDDIELLTPEEVRQTTFKQVRERILTCVEKGQASNILVASFQQAGKSYLVSDIAAELGKRGINVLIAVPTGKLAKELAERMKERGVKAFALASHKAIFDKQLRWMNFNCPYYKEIQEESKLGINSTEYKASYCSTCSFFDICYYPKQYTQVKEEQYNIVIIQHAHLSCQEVMFDLAKKGFEVMFIDESFIDHCYASIKVDKEEIAAMEKCRSIPWMHDLTNWVRCFKEAKGYINPSKEELNKVQKIMRDASMPWRVPDLIRYYNQHRSVNKMSGIEIVYELPNTPIKVLTDATPPEELTKQVTGIQHLSVYGDKEVLDYKRIHPENEIIQILDVSASKAALAKDNLFENEMMKIGELCEMKYTEEKVLLVTYSSHIPKVMDFFESHSEEFPEVCKRLTVEDGPDNPPNEIRVAVMDKGTNKYASYGVQFLQAGVHFTGYQYEHAIYQYKTAANYYHEKHGTPYLTNVYPYDMSKNIGTALEEYPVKRIEYIDDKHAGVFEYPDFSVYIPSNTWHYTIYRYNVARTQQAIRVRFLSGKRTIVYVLSNLFLPSFAISKSILLEEFLKPLDNSEDLW